MTEELATALKADLLGPKGVVMTEVDCLREIFGSPLPASVPAPLDKDPDEVVSHDGVSRKRGRRYGGEEAGEGGERGGEGPEKEGERERRLWHRGGG